MRGSDPTPEEEAAVTEHAAARRVQRLAGWHHALVSACEKAVPTESSCQFATRILGREIKFLDELTGEEIEKLRAELRKLSGGGEA